jgi:hypothetical protein
MTTPTLIFSTRTINHLGFSEGQIGTVLTIHLAAGRALLIVTDPWPTVSGSGY